MKTLFLALTFLVPGLIHAAEPAASGNVTTSTVSTANAPQAAVNLPQAIDVLSKSPAVVPAVNSTGAIDLTQAQSMNGSNAEILLAPLAAPEPSSMAFSACAIALVAVLFLRMRLSRER